MSDLINQTPMNTLFVKETFKSHSGLFLTYKIECDALTDEDIACLSYLVRDISGPFSKVVGIPRGGLRLAAALQPYCYNEEGGRFLIVDDVLTTGTSMWEMFAEISMTHNPNLISGVVLFSRGTLPRWCQAVFSVNDRCWQ